MKTVSTPYITADKLAEKLQVPRAIINSLAKKGMLTHSQIEVGGKIAYPPDTTWKHGKPRSKDLERALSRAEAIPGRTYQIKELSYAVRFTDASGDEYETITHTSNYGCKRDCWNYTKKRMEQLSPTMEVKII